MTPNPFTFGNPIKDPTRFHGREADIRQVVNRLLSSAHESTSIVGERRIGKTSLLKHLENKQVAAQLGLVPSEFCMLYMDFQGLTDISPDRFWQRVLQKMERIICKPELIPEIRELRGKAELDLFDLEDMFTYITDQGLTIVFLLDEFEYVTQNPNFGPDFFGGLRALAIHQNIPLVTATRRELVDLCHSEELKGSPFFNIFANIVLKPFEHDEVLELLDDYLSQSELKFSDKEKELVYLLGGGYPFFTQMAGNYLFEGKQNGLEGDILLRDVDAKFDAQSNSHFNYMWSHLSESEKITLLTVMSLCHQKQSAKTHPTLENLAALHPRAHLDIPELLKRGMLLEDKNKQLYRTLSPSLERWIAREITSAPGEEESAATVDEWLNAGGRSDLEQVKGVFPKFKKKYWSVIGNLAKDISVDIIKKLAIQMLTTGL